MTCTLRNAEMIRDAVAAGIRVHAGTDAGGFVEHGRIADEVTAMGELIGARQAMFAASHSARDWLGLPSYDIGEPADLMIYADDPAEPISACCGIRRSSSGWVPGQSVSRLSSV